MSAWLSIDSKRWRLRSYNDAQAAITQTASNATRYVSRGTLPNVEALSAMSEVRFDSIMREAFHSAAH